MARYPSPFSFYYSNVAQDPVFVEPAPDEYLVGGFHSFDGTDEEIQLPAGLFEFNEKFIDAFTVSFWFYMPADYWNNIQLNGSFSQDFAFIGNQKYYVDGVYGRFWGWKIGGLKDSQGKLRAIGELFGPNGGRRRTRNFTISADTWYHLVAEYNPATYDFNIYVDGTTSSGGSTNYPAPGINGTFEGSQLTIGATTNGYNYGGKLSNVAIWDGTVASQVISQTYSSDKKHLNYMEIANPPDLLYIPLSCAGDSAEFVTVKVGPENAFCANMEEASVSKRGPRFLYSGKKLDRSVENISGVANENPAELEEFFLGTGEKYK